MNNQQKFIYNRIQNNKPESVKINQVLPVGTVVYYEQGDGIGKAEVLVSGGTTTYLSNYDWCYNWQLVAESKIPVVMRF